MLPSHPGPVSCSGLTWEPLPHCVSGGWRLIHGQSTGCFSGGTGFRSQHGGHNHRNCSSRGANAPSGLCRHQTHMWCTAMKTSKTHIHVKISLIGVTKEDTDFDVWAPTGAHVGGRARTMATHLTPAWTVRKTLPQNKVIQQKLKIKFN